MQEHEWLAERFETQRSHLRAVAYRMLGSQTEADDAVQEAWLRISRSDVDKVENLASWLTTVVGRICLDMLRSRTSRKESPLDIAPGELPAVGRDPEQEAILADAVGEALLVVLETLNPAERLAFVLHDLFALPFEEIAPIIGRSPVATRQLASRARRRVRGGAGNLTGETAATQQREVVSAFLAASRDGQFGTLISLLDPEAVVWSDRTATQSGSPQILEGADAIATMFNGRAKAAQLATIDGVIGMVWAPEGAIRIAFDFTLIGHRITRIDIFANPEFLLELPVAILAS